MTFSNASALSKGASHTQHELRVEEELLTDRHHSMHSFRHRTTVGENSMFLKSILWLAFLALGFETDPLQRVLVSVGLHFNLPFGRNYHEYYAQEAGVPPYFIFDAEVPHTLATVAVLAWLVTYCVAATITFRRHADIKSLFMTCTTASLPLWASWLDQKASLDTRSIYLTLSYATVWLSLLQSWLILRTWNSDSSSIKLS